MKEFVLLFRQADPNNLQETPAQKQIIMKRWEDWIGGLAAQGKFGSRCHRLSSQGKVLKAGGIITDGPFVEVREALGGFIVVKAENLDEAITLAHGCPAIDYNGSVEIRPFLG
jgi:hypothetical protein